MFEALTRPVSFETSDAVWGVLMCGMAVALLFRFLRMRRAIDEQRRRDRERQDEPKA